MKDSFSPSFLRPEIPGFTPAPRHVPENAHVAQALERHKREGMELAVKARIIAMSIVIVMLFFISPWPLFLYLKDPT